MWSEYTKIDTVLQRDLDGTKRLIPWSFRDPAVRYLRSLPWEVTEKVDGTNVSIYFDGYRVEIHGRTKAAELPKELMEVLEAKFLNDETEELFEQLFPVKHFHDDAGEQVASDVVTEVSIFGEGIGPKIQKVGKLYGDEYRFLVFDIKVGGVFLEHSSEFYGKIVQAFGLETVPDLPDMTIEEAEEYVKMKPQSLVNPKAPMEGLVLRPKVRLYNAKGERIIVKVKCRDYEPYNEAAEKYGWIKKGKAVVWDREGMDGRTMVVIPRRCTIKDILPAGGAPSPDYKVQSEDDHIVLRDIDNPGVEYVAKPGELRRYDKQQWLDYVMESKNAEEER